MTLYTTAEPCPTSSTAVLWAGIPRVVYGTSVETLNGLGFTKLDLSIQEISHRTSLGEPEVIGGCWRTSATPSTRCPPIR